MKKFLTLLIVLFIGLSLIGCSAKSASSFDIPRRVNVYNVVTGVSLFEVEGLCAFSETDDQLTVTCKVEGEPEIGEDGRVVETEDYMTHFFDLSEDVSYSVEQTGLEIYPTPQPEEIESEPHPDKNPEIDPAVD